MPPTADWVEREEALLARLRDRPRGPARAALLAELALYADDVVRAVRCESFPAIGLSEVTGDAGWLERPVFLCGHHRTGTTLLQALLDGHPELVVLPSEGTYLSSFRYVAHTNPGPRELDAFAAEWVSRLVDPSHAPHFKLGRSTANTQPYVSIVRRMLAWQAQLPQSMPGLARFSALLALLALVAAYRDVALPGSAPRMWAEKTPLNERNVQKLAVFGHARFIHVVRNPGDSFASLLRALHMAGGTGPARAVHAAAIGNSLRLAATNAARWPDRYLVVKYEDLTDSTAREMERVRAFLGIGEHPTLTQPTAVGIAVQANSSFDRGAAGVVKRSRHGGELAPADSRLLAAFAGDPARAFGYDLAHLSGWQRSLLRARYAPMDALRRLRIAQR